MRVPPPKPLLHEFMVNEYGHMIHVRTGTRVSQFEIEAKNPLGRPILMKFAADTSGWEGFWAVAIKGLLRFARLTNGKRLQIKGEHNVQH